ncbi:MAG: MerR family transcriptional regulator [Gallionella sp.]|nr:MerR family transcriptional regulator [Gallionella sp.]
MNLVLNSIASVERETGIGKDTLRVWEKRYGFPIPARNARGERLYPAAQIEQLILVKRLLDKGIRPGKVVGLDCAALENMLVDEAVVVTASEPHIAVLFELIKVGYPA